MPLTPMSSKLTAPLIDEAVSAQLCKDEKTDLKHDPFAERVIGNLQSAFNAHCWGAHN